MQSSVGVEHEPATPALCLLTAAQDWADCRAALSDVLQWFHFWRASSPGSAAASTDANTTPLRLPRTPVQLDDVLCVAVAESRSHVSLSALDKVAMLKWLLLPYEARRHLRRPFSAANIDDAAASTCWACAVKVCIF